MANFFFTRLKLLTKASSPLINSKKIAVFAILFFVISGVVLPASSAQAVEAMITSISPSPINYTPSSPPVPVTVTITGTGLSAATVVTTIQCGYYYIQACNGQPIQRITTVTGPNTLTFRFVPTLSLYYRVTVMNPGPTGGGSYRAVEVRVTGDGYDGNTIFGSIYNSIETATGIIRDLQDKITKLSDFSSVTFNNFGTVLIVSIADMFSWAAYYIAMGSTKLLSTLLESMINDSSWAITRATIPGCTPGPSTTCTTFAGAALLNAWNLVKVWANLFIVLSFVGVAIATIIRWHEYEAKKHLPKLIMVAILVNFSIVFCGLMIDASNITIRALSVGGDNEIGIFYKINRGWNNIAMPYRPPFCTAPAYTDDNNFSSRYCYENYTINKAMTYFVINLIFDGLYLAFAFGLLFLSFILVERYILMAILFVISPLAFVFYAVPVPKAKEQFSKWWGMFMKYCLLGIPAAFFLMLSSTILGSYNWPGGQLTANGNWTQIWEALIPPLVHLGIVILFLIVGLRMAQKSAGPIASAIMGAVTATGMAIATGGGSLAGTAAGAMGLGRLKDGVGRAREKIKEGTVGALESMGWYAPGTQNTMRKENLEKRYGVDEETKKTMGNAGLPQLNSYATMTSGALGKPLTSTQVRQKIAAIQELANRDQIKNLTQDQQQATAQYAIDSGVKSDEVVGKMSKEAQGDAIRRGLFSAGIRAKIFKSLADKKNLDVLTMNEQIDAMREAATSGVNPEDVVSKLDTRTQAEIINTNLFNPETRGKAVESLMKKKQLHLISDARRAQAIEEARRSGVDVEDLEAADYHYADYNHARLASLGATQTQINNGTVPTAIINAARGQVLDENVSKMTDDQLRRMDAGDITYARILKLTPEKIAAFEYELPDPSSGIRERVAALKTLIVPGSALVTAMNTAHTIATTTTNQAEANSEYQKYERLLKLYNAIDALT